jgi:hypothetical protein
MEKGSSKDDFVSFIRSGSDLGLKFTQIFVVTLSLKSYLV